MATLYDLFHTANKETVFNELFAYYPQEKINEEAYNSAWDEILSLQSETSEMVCVLSKSTDVNEDDQYYYVHGWSNTESGWYSIQLTEWEIWLGMPYGVDDETIKDNEVNPEQFLAHVLYEMTYSGWDNTTVASRKQEIIDAVAELNEKLASGQITIH